MGWLLVPLLLYGGLLLLVVAFQRNLQYFPIGRPGDAAAATAGQMRTVGYPTADGLSLTAWYGPARDGRPTLVYFHGNAGHLGDRFFAILPYLHAGYGVLLAGYRGYGGNPGRPTEAGLYADGRAALDWLAGQGVAADRVVLYGESLGTGVAVQLATEVPAAGIVLQAPFTSAVDIGQSVYWFLPVRLLMRDRYDSLSKIDRIGAPLLLIHGEADRLIPADFGRRLFAAAPEPKSARFIPGAGHNDLDPRTVAAAVLEFMAGLPAPVIRASP